MFLWRDIQKQSSNIILEYAVIDSEWATILPISAGSNAHLFQLRVTKKLKRNKTNNVILVTRC